MGTDLSSSRLKAEREGWTLTRALRSAMATQGSQIKPAAPGRRRRLSVGGGKGGAVEDDGLLRVRAAGVSTAFCSTARNPNLLQKVPFLYGVGRNLQPPPSSGTCLSAPPTPAGPTVSPGPPEVPSFSNTVPTPACEIFFFSAHARRSDFCRRVDIRFLSLCRSMTKIEA